MTAFVDTNVLIRHLTGDPPGQAARATRLLSRAGQLLLPDLIVAEVVYVLESVYKVPRPRVAELARAIVAFPAIEVADEPVLLRALEVYEVHRLDFADAYLVAEAEISGVNAVASFDKAIERVPTVRRVEPSLVGTGQAQGVLGHVVQHHLAADRGGRRTRAIPQRPAMPYSVASRCRRGSGWRRRRLAMAASAAAYLAMLAASPARAPAS